MNIYAHGTARIRHRGTGEIFAIGADQLDWNEVGADERDMGYEATYMAVVEHPELGELSWTLWEYPMGAENDREVDLNGHELVEPLTFGLEHLPEDQNEEPVRKGFLADRLAALPDQLDALEQAVAALRGHSPSLGHNQPPEEFRLGLDDADLDAADRDIATLRTELARHNAIDRAEPEQIAAAQSGLRRLSTKLWNLAKWTVKMGAGGIVAEAGKELWQDPVALHHKVVSILEIVGVWLRHLIG